MATVPLIRNKNDVFYRYQMPKLTAKIEGSGNGIRTVISNMSLIAKSINRPAAYATKFFGYELGAQTKMDVKADIYSVNGSHDAEKLLSLLYLFIEKFVLCSSCENPETDMSVNKKMISLKCKACGATTTITERTHKLTTFIANHSEDTANKKSSKEEKKDKKSKSKSSKGDDSATTTGTPTTTTTGTKSSSKNKQANNDFDNDGFSDEELVPDPSLVLADEFKANVNIADTCEKFCQLVKEKEDSNQLGDAKVQKELLAEANTLGIRDKSTLALCKALFDENIVEQIGKHQVLFVRFCVDNAKAQKYLLGGIEKIIELFPKLLAITARILKEFYDKEIIDEEVFIDWYDKPSKKYVSKDLAKTIREKAHPFIKWLKEAEEESGDEDDDDNNNNKNGGSSSPTGNNNKTLTGAAAAAANSNDDDDEDEDDGIGFSHKVSGIKVESVKKQEEEVDDAFIDDI